MKLSPDEARDIVYGDHEDWQSIEENIVRHSRWSVHSEGIFLHKPTNQYYQFNWSRGATEYQDEQAFEYDTEVTPIKVKQVKVEITKFVKDE